MEEVNGADTAGTSYKSISELWKKELVDDDKRRQWYGKATDYWQAQEPTLAGIMGGYPETSGPDLRESKRFLQYIREGPNPPAFHTALDCGAGIGRVTKNLLLDEFQVVDLVEPDPKFLETARKEIANPRAERYIVSSLQDFSPEPGRYDVIWAQWVLLYLPDDDLIRFFERCIAGLKNEKGMIFVKENVILEGSWLVDKEDNSISRTDTQIKAIFRQSGLRLMHEMKQTCWPPDLIPVKMYALRPDDSVKGKDEAAAPKRRPAEVRRKPAAAR